MKKQERQKDIFYESLESFASDSDSSCGHDAKSQDIWKNHFKVDMCVLKSIDLNSSDEEYSSSSSSDDNKPEISKLND